MNRCPHCGVELDASSPGGLCPACLMVGGLESQVTIRLGHDVPAPGTILTQAALEDDRFGPLWSAKNNSALRISTIRAIGSDVKSTLRVGRFADVTSAEPRRNNVMHLLATRWFYGEWIYCGAQRETAIIRAFALLTCTKRIYSGVFRLSHVPDQDRSLRRKLLRCPPSIYRLARQASTADL